MLLGAIWLTVFSGIDSVGKLVLRDYILVLMGLLVTPMLLLFPVSGSISEFFEHVFHGVGMS